MFLFPKKGNFRLVLNKFFYPKLANEFFIIMCFGLTLFLGLSFFSYNNLDPSFLYFSNNKLITMNFCGKIGAGFSAFVFYFLGCGSFLLLFFPIAWIFMKLAELRIRDEYLRVFGLLVLVLTASSFFEMFKLEFLNSYRGGLFGFELCKFLNFYFNDTGTYLFLSILFFLAIVLIFKISLVLFLSILINNIFSSISNKFFSFCGLIRNIFYVPFGKNKKSEPNYYPNFNNYRNYRLYNGYYLEPENFIYDIQACDFYIDNFKEDHKNVLNQFVPASMDFQLNLNNKQIPEFLDEVLKSLVLKFSGFKVFNLNMKPRFTYFCKCRIKKLPNNILNKNLFNLIRIFYHEFFVDLTLPELNLAPTSNIKSNFEISKPEPKIEYILPDLSIFENERTTSNNKELLEAECKEQARRLEEKLFHFGINGKITAIRPGPVITLFEYAPDIDTKISKITALEDDLALALKAMSIRILAPIPGRALIGFEISNQSRETVLLSDILLSDQFKNNRANLPIVLGVDIVGAPLVEDLASMPHLLIAGSTGSGKSVGLNSMLVGLLCKLTPDQLKLILVDPKRLEFATYSDIPHLLFPIITDARKVSLILKWVVSEMDRRYSVMANFGVRNLFDYYSAYESKKSQDPKMEYLPWIVIIIDELADVMMVAGKEVEFYITRIAQMARAAGIHMIVATQRPSVDVVTGIIKVNFPSRIGYRVSSKIDSKTILDSSGAEKLLGKGDLLYLNPKGISLERVHGPYIADKEIKMLTDYLRSKQKAKYLDINEIAATNDNFSEEEKDELYMEIVNYVKTIDEISISMLQRKYRIGFNRSARLIEQLEREGILAPAQGSKPRKVLRM